MQAFAQDSLSNLAASLNAGKDKAAQDSFFVVELGRGQIEAMYRGDWLARKIVDIVPHDMVREWREWSGERSAVAAAEAAERRLDLRKVVGRALTLGRLHGGAAILVGTGAERPAELAAELDPDSVRAGDVKFLQVVSRWQLGVPRLNRDPLDRWCGEPAVYELSSPERGTLQIHPSRVVRFLGHALPDPALGPWSDSVLQVLYDAVHAVALTQAGATSLMHEAKVDIVTVPNLAEHLSSASTTAQLSARFSYAAAMKSLNNLLLLGDGESWGRQTIDFAGLPEMVRTFLQVAAGAADIPVTRLLGQSPAGLNATGASDTRQYYDMIAARQALDLRPQLDRLDALILRSAGLDPGSLTSRFRPLWQLSAAEKAAVALQKAQTTQIYAGLGLWDTATTARLVQSQLVEDGVYPGAAEVFGAGEAAPTLDYSPDQPRDPQGRWTEVGGASGQESNPPDPSAYKAGVPEKIFHQVDFPTEGGEIPGAPTQATGVFAPATGGDLKRPDSEPIGHAPDEEPIRVAALRGKPGLGTAKAIATLLGAVARLLQRWRAREPDDPDAPLHAGVDPGSHRAPSSLPADSDDNGRLEPSPPGLVITVRGSSTKGSRRQLL